MSPAKIWARFMKSALAKTPKHDFVLPTSEVKRVRLCDGSGRYEYFLLGTEPARDCSERAEPIATVAPIVNDPDQTTNNDDAAAITPQPVVRATAPPPAPVYTDHNDLGNDSDPNVPVDGK